MTYTKENTKVLQNGNWYPSEYSQVKGTSLVEVSTFQGKKTALLNVSNNAITFKNGYDTQNNGRCDDLTIKPGEGIWRSAKGDAYDFGMYRVFKA